MNSAFKYDLLVVGEELAEVAYNEHGWEMSGYYWSGFATRAKDMFRMYRYKQYFEYRKQNPMVEVAAGVLRNEAVLVTGEWEDSKMYCPYPYEDTTYNPGLNN